MEDPGAVLMLTGHVADAAQTARRPLFFAGNDQNEAEVPRGAGQHDPTDVAGASCRWHGCRNQAERFAFFEAGPAPRI